jgi:hypothetical protein
MIHDLGNDDNSRGVIIARRGVIIEIRPPADRGIRCRQQAGKVAKRNPMFTKPDSDVL